MHQTLNSVFGFDTFRANQEEIISNTLNGGDVFSIMPTGSGKSLCYQLPAVMMDGVCVVVSPLVALMKDQVDGAQANGISAALINSTLTNEEKYVVMKQLNAGQTDLLYVTPERLRLDSFWDYLKTIKISAFAIDEAHCISEWGHDFRPDYLVLANLKRDFPDVPVAAFTASATETVERDILNRLGLTNPFVVKASFDRPNLFYQVECKQTVNEQIIDFIRLRPDESGIVYRTTRKDVESTAAFLSTNGISALPYHAGMDPEERRVNQETFNCDEVPVIVATIAFGMGIDKSNIRFVVHGDLPKSMENYYQETGRAGRDGEPAHCLLFYSMNDVDTQNYFISQIEDPAEKKRSADKLASMINFAGNDACRRTALLNYFGEIYPVPECGTCDRCKGDFDIVDVTKEAQILLSGILRTEEVFGINHVIDVVRGANTKKIRRFKHETLKTHGAGKHLNKSQWLEIYNHLLASGYVKRLSQENNRVVVSPSGKTILYGRESISIKRKKADNSMVPAAVEYDKTLFSELKALRRDLADERLVPPYVIFSDRSLHDMARYYPVDATAFLAMSGVGQRKLEDVGDAFMGCITQYLNDHPDTDINRFGKPTINAAPRYKKATNPTLYKETLRLLEKGLDLDAVARRQGRKPSTVVSHIEKARDNGETIAVEHLIDTPLRKEAETAFAELGASALSPVFYHLDETVPYEQLKLIRICLEA